MGGRSRLARLVSRWCARTVRTAIPSALGCAITTTSRLPRVTPVYNKLRFEQREMLGAERNHHRGIFRSLAFMDRGRVGQRELIEFAKRIQHRATLNVDVHPPFFQVNVANASDVAVEHLFIIVVDLLEHFIARRIGPTKPLELRGRVGIELLLQRTVERARADEAAVPRREHLNIGNRIEPEALGNPLLTTRRTLSKIASGVCGVDEIKVTHRSPLMAAAAAGPD